MAYIKWPDVKCIKTKFMLFSPKNNLLYNLSCKLLLNGLEIEHVEH